jgi:hypothetical protein
MADLKLTTDHDLEFSGGDLVLLDGVDAIAQDCDIRMMTFLGEWFLDTRIGVPYFEKILGEKPRLVALKGIFRDAIMSTPGIESISDFQIDFDGLSRELSISFLADTVEGTFSYNKELVI